MREPGAGGRAVCVTAVTILSRLAAGDKILLCRLRAGRRGKLASLRIYGFFHHSSRGLEVLCFVICRQCNGALHKLTPNRRRSRAPSQSYIAVIVKSNPNDAEKVRGVTGEPAVARGARLPRCGRI